jgi:hypothetical protein
MKKSTILFVLVAVSALSTSAFADSLTGKAMKNMPKDAVQKVVSRDNQAKAARKVITRRVTAPHFTFKGKTQ